MALTAAGREPADLTHPTAGRRAGGSGGGGARNAIARAGGLRSDSTKLAKPGILLESGKAAAAVAAEVGRELDPSSDRVTAALMRVVNQGEEMAVAANAVAPRSPLEVVPEKYRGAVGRAFEGTPIAETLQEDLIAYRRWGGKASETGSPWYSTTRYQRPGNARRDLALPEGNNAENLTVFQIPKGTTILRGKAASLAGEPGFGTNAVGGGQQIFLPDPRKAIKLE